MAESLMDRRVRVKHGPAAGKTGWVVDSVIVDVLYYGILMDSSGAVTWGGFSSWKLETTHTAEEDKAERARLDELERATRAQRLPDVSGRSGLLGRGRRR